MPEKRYRVRSPVKSFRDLEVYQKTIKLSSGITTLFLSKKGFEKDSEEIKVISEKIPRLIAESYSDKFDSKELANKKLTEAMTLIAGMVTKIDLLRERFSEDKEMKEALDKFLVGYQNQRRKIFNLRKAWDRVFSNDKSSKDKNGSEKVR